MSPVAATGLCRGVVAASAALLRCISGVLPDVDRSRADVSSGVASAADAECVAVTS